MFQRPNFVERIGQIHFGGVVMASLSIIEGVGEAFEAKLKAAGVSSTSALMEKGATKKGRAALAAECDISEKLILKWVNHVDLMRVKGIGGEYAELLEAAGVDTVPELAQRKPENLLAKMTEVNEAKNLVRKLPVLKQVEDWVDQAKELPKVVSH